MALKSNFKFDPVKIRFEGKSDVILEHSNGNKEVCLRKGDEVALITNESDSMPVTEFPVDCEYRVGMLIESTKDTMHAPQYDILDGVETIVFTSKAVTVKPNKTDEWLGLSTLGLGVYFPEQSEHYEKFKTPNVKYKVTLKLKQLERPYTAVYEIRLNIGCNHFDGSDVKVSQIKKALQEKLSNLAVNRLNSTFKKLEVIDNNPPPPPPERDENEEEDPTNPKQDNPENK